MYIKAWKKRGHQEQAKKKKTLDDRPCIPTPENGEEGRTGGDYFWLTEVNSCTGIN